MMTGDVETRLDEALTQLANGVPAEDIARQAPAESELVQVAQRLQALAVAPQPQLAQGRRKFLEQAARLDQSRYSKSWLGWSAPLRQLFSSAPAALVAAAVLLLVVGGTLAIVARGVLAGQATPPSLQATLTQPDSPTSTVTPTRLSFAMPDQYAALSSVGSLSVYRPSVYQPVVPCPTPAAIAGEVRSLSHHPASVRIQ